MEIQAATLKDAAVLARIISQANVPVAKEFGLTPENAPTHPSLCTAQWIVAGMERGETYSLVRSEGAPAGCVAYESPEPDLAFLNRLAVLPQCQGQGLGRALVSHILDRAGRDGKKAVSIGIIKAHTRLASWYASLGFVPAGEKVFDHLPFDVLFMRYEL